MSTEKEQFDLELQKIYQELFEKQERLGEEFDRIWFENLDELYEN